jgi:chromate transporter
MALLAAVYLAFGRIAGVQAIFAGMQAAVVAIVAQAVLRMARRASHSRLDWSLAAAAFMLIAVVNVPFPLVVALSAATSAMLGRTSVAAAAPDVAPADWGASLRMALLWLAVWMAPLVLIAVTQGASHGLFDLGVFFAKLAAASFGGAYAGLAYVAQGAAAGHSSGLMGWVTPAEIVDGLALAETTPGPLVLVYQFIGALAGYRITGLWTGAAIGMALVLWMTFAPSFLLIFALAPHLERLLARPQLAKALQGVTAAVVGVMASLGLWFALHVLFAGVAVHKLGMIQLWWPQGGINYFAAGVGLAALGLLARLGMLPVLGLAMAAGLARWLFNG